MCVCVCVYSPAGSLGEHDVVVVLRRALDERDARVVLPVAHRLFEQRLVRACKTSSMSEMKTQPAKGHQPKRQPNRDFRVSFQTLGERR